MGILNNRKGSIVIPLITTVAITIGLVSYYFSEYYRIRKSVDFQYIYKSNIINYIGTVKTLLLSQSSFVKTMKSTKNGNLWSCLNDPEFNCLVTGAQPLSLVADDGSDASLFHDAATGAGFDYDFNKCSGFPSTSCPFRYELTWSTECATPSNCRLPGILVSGVVKFDPSFAKKYIINADNYKMMVRIR